MNNQYKTTICPYCKEPAKQVTGEIIYPNRADLSNLQFYLCKPCNAYVGCHATGKPLGSLADAELRSMRRECHAVFDKTWNNKKSRHIAYKELAEKMNMTKQDCHIGKFNIKQCQDLLALFGG